MSRVAFDTNILVYLSGGVASKADVPKSIRVQQLVDRLITKSQFVVSVQALGELFTVIKKITGDLNDARSAVTSFAMQSKVIATDLNILGEAFDLVIEHRFQSWDAIIVCAAQAAGCDILLSEDMQHGFVYRNVTIVNPFAEPQHPKLARLLND